MIRIFALCLALLTLVACDGDDLSVSEEESPEGIRFTLVQMPERQDVAFQIAWATDWARRPDANQTAPYVGAQLILAGGAEGFAPGEAGELFADLNAEAGLAASVDHIYGTLVLERGTLDQVLPAAQAHLEAPALDPMWFDRIRQSIAGDVAEGQGDPNVVGYDAARWAVFGDQPVRRALSLDEAAEWEALTPGDVAQWRIETLTRAPAAVVVAGDIDAATAGQAVDQLLSALPEARPASGTPPSADMSPRRILLHRPDASTSHLGLIAPLPPTREGGEFEDILLMQALGQGDQSALFDAVRTRLRASYAFGAGFANYTRAHRILVMQGAVDTDKLAEAETVVRAAYDQFLAEGPGGDLAARKAPVLANLGELPDLPSRMAYSVLESLLDGFPPDRALGLIPELEAVTDASIRARLDTAYAPADALIVIAVSPDETALPGACVITAPADAMECP